MARTFSRRVSGPGASHDFAGIAALGVKAKADCHTFEEYDAYLGYEYEKGLAAKIVVKRVDKDQIAVVLYDTQILVFHRNGTFYANDGGFQTPTTRNRLMQFGPRGWHFGFGHGKLWGGFGFHDAAHECDKDKWLPGNRFYVKKGEWPTIIAGDNTAYYVIDRENTLADGNNPHYFANPKLANDAAERLERLSRETQVAVTETVS